MSPSSLVWYVSYGSNMCLSRLQCYLSGGTPDGGARAYPGARDPRPPRESRGVWLPGGVYFSGESTVWSGGMAFYDPDLPGRAAARAHLVTVEQFSDIAAQEMHRDPDAVLDLAQVLREGRTAPGPGRYETLVCPGELDGLPMLTFTCPEPLAEATLTRPSPAYLAVLTAGLREAHHWDEETAAGYLGSLSGILGPGHGSSGRTSELVPMSRASSSIGRAPDF